MPKTSLFLPLLAVACVDCLAPSLPRLPEAAAVGEPRYLKGQLHLHSSGSGDSDTPPSDVIRWYQSRGYDFIVFTDHNTVTAPPQPAGGMLVLRGVEITQNTWSCSPPPEGRYRCLLHVNALFVSSGMPLGWAWVTPFERIDSYTSSLRLATEMGGIALLNHPNYHYAASPDTILELSRRGLRLLEIANEAVDSNNQGDATHPSTEQLWDYALSAGATLWGVASDDAHHYYDAAQVRSRGRNVYDGDRGFVMVWSQRDPTSIRRAIETGDFYSSSGVLLERSTVADGVLRVRVSAQSAGDHAFQFVGPGGRVLHSARGREASLQIALLEPGYVRVVVEDDQHRKAWVQPVRVPVRGPVVGLVQ